MAARPALSPAYISICTGGAGLDAGIRLAWPGAAAVCYVERELSEAAVLAKAIEVGIVADAPVWSDLFTFRGRDWRGLMDGIVGGIPCQPHSFAGKRLGAGDPRNLWPVTARLVFDAAPTWCFFENVPGIAEYYWSNIRPDLQALGYEVTEGIFSAEEVGAPHLRERLFWLAYRDGGGRGAAGVEGATQPDSAQRGAELADAIDGAGSAEQQLEPEERPAKPRLGGGTVADAGGPEHVRQAAATGEGEPRRAAAGGPGQGVGDAASRQREGQALRAGQSAFPPGPGDAGGWQRWLAEWPGTEPATNGRLNPSFVEGLMNWPIGSTSLGEPADPLLLELWARLAAETLRQTPGGPERLSEADILRPELLRRASQERRAITQRNAEARLLPEEELLRAVRDYWHGHESTSNPPQGPGLAEQRRDQPSDLVRFVSFIAASCRRRDQWAADSASMYVLRQGLLSECLRNLSDADQAAWDALPAGLQNQALQELALTFSNLAQRADRLRVLGNGVVPVAAAHALRTLAARLGVMLWQP